MRRRNATAPIVLWWGVMFLSLPAAWGQVIGETRSRLDTLNADKQEATFCNLAADAFRASAKADIALINASAFSPGSINPGSITTAQVESLFQFPNDRLVVVELSGETITRMMERSVGVYPTPNDGFLHVSGLKVVFDPSRPSGERIVSIKRVEGGKELPLDSSKSYRVATCRAIARGGLGYFKIVGPNVQIQTLNETAAESVVNFIRAAGSVNYGKENRVSAK